MNLFSPIWWRLFVFLLSASLVLAGCALKEAPPPVSPKPTSQSALPSPAVSEEQPATANAATATSPPEAAPTPPTQPFDQAQGKQTPTPAPRPTPVAIPLTDMTAADRYKGEDGGLYGGGLNTPPPQHREAALKALSEVRPLDAGGVPSPDGKIVLVSIGMSNTTQEFSVFKKLADADPEKSPNLTIVVAPRVGRLRSTGQQRSSPGRC